MKRCTWLSTVLWYTHHTITVHHITHYTATVPFAGRIHYTEFKRCPYHGAACRIHKNVLVWLKLKWPHSSVIQVCWSGVHSGLILPSGTMLVSPSSSTNARLHNCEILVARQLALISWVIVLWLGCWMCVFSLLEGNITALEAGCSVNKPFKKVSRTSICTGTCITNHHNNSGNVTFQLSSHQDLLVFYRSWGHY